jgi:hypothetical protein
MSRRRRTFVLGALFSLIVSFAFGYYVGGKQAKRGFPEIIEVWQKEEGVRISQGASPSTLWFPDGVYRMYYTTAEGIVSAVSYNGLTWIKEGGVRLTPDHRDENQERVGNPVVFPLKNGRYRMVYEGSDIKQARRYLFSAYSEDGITWIREKGIRLQDKNEYGAILASVPNVITLPKGKLRMYYSTGSRIKAAVSSDEGLTWKKEKITGIDSPATDPNVVLIEDGFYKMYYTISDSPTKPKNLRIVSARSTDGLNWERERGTRIKADEGAVMVMDPDVVTLSMGKLRMYYSQLDKGSLEPRESAEPPAISIRSATLER